VTPGYELSIIVPCYNEGENVLELAERASTMFAARHIQGEVVFVNDCSKDNTGTLIDELAARHEFVQAVHHQVNRGMPGGWRSGVEAARGRYVAIMDGDLQYLPEDVYRLYRQLKYTNADIVQGWRSHIGRPRDFRYTMSRVLHYMLRALFGSHLHDIKSGFLVCEREVFDHILRHRFHYYYFQTFIVVSAIHKGYRVEEIESLFEERKLGESFISAFPLKMILKNLVDVAKGFVEFRLLARRTDVLAEVLARHVVAPRGAPASLARRAYLRLFTALMPLHHWKHSPQALRYFDQLRRTQWMSAEQLRELQDTRLRATLKDAYHHVPYYRETFDRLGIEPAAVRSVDDLARLPLLSRETVRRNLHFDLISEMHDKRRMLPISTSGARGEPLSLYTDSADLEQRWANALRAREWAGYHFGDSVVALWDSGRDRGLRARLAALLSRRTVLCAVERDQAAIGASLEELRHGVSLVEGDSEVLGLTALLTDAAPAVEGVGAVITRGQTLTGEARAAIERRFGAPVYDVYGIRELGEIAQECEAKQGYHVNAESFLVEILCDGRGARPGEVGEIVVTGLTNRSVPLIRYATGDRARLVAEPCPCGRSLPRLDAIEGRPATVLVGANGCFVPGSYFADVLAEQGHVIRRFRVTQSRPGAIDMQIVPGPRYSERWMRALLAEFRVHLGADTVIDVTCVESIGDAVGGAASVGAAARTA
jgi:phenylacetate-CoA ligase